MQQTQAVVETKTENVEKETVPQKKAWQFNYDKLPDVEQIPVKPVTITVKGPGTLPTLK